MPLSDWRDGDGPCRRGGGVDLRSRLSERQRRRRRGLRLVLCRRRGPRRRRIRTPIVDGAYGEDWVFRYKDLVSWWSQAALQPAGRGQGGGADGVAAAVEADLVHRARLPGGGQGHEPAERLPRSEVVRELLSVLFDRGAGRPHPVPLPSGYVRPLERSRRTTRHSDVYAGRMVDMSRAHVWAWDARPWPDFPGPAGDLGRWRRTTSRGHWLNGRASDRVARRGGGGDLRAVRRRRARCLGAARRGDGLSDRRGGERVGRACSR